MAIRKLAAGFIVAMALAGSIKPSHAGPSPVVVGGAYSNALGVAGFAAVSVVAVATVLVGYDLWLKINGLKNWDGTPKLGHGRLRRH